MQIKSFFPVIFLCFNFTGAWFSWMHIDSSHLIMSLGVRFSTHTLKCRENLPDFHGEAFGSSLRSACFGGGVNLASGPEAILWQKRKQAQGGAAVLGLCRL